MVEDEVVASQLEALLTPAITAQENYYRQLGLRDRILNLPLMVAAVLTLLWRDVAGVTELTRMLARDGFLWCSPKSISQQAISQRFLTFPACLFEGDAVAEELSLPFDHISLEMIYRGLYHFSVAHQKGKAIDPVKYFAAPENQDLGIVKQPRKPNVKLIVSPFPEQQRGSDQFFFKPLLQSP
jgi:hypothetical protein